MSQIYAIGDLHGEITLLRQLLATLPLAANDQLIFLGDYMDRGEDSVATVLFLAELAERQPCIFLQGNHDEAWLEWWDGERFTRAPTIPGARKVWEAAQGNLPPAVGRFLAATRLSYADGYAYYSHAGAQPDVPFAATPREVLVWGHHAFFTSPGSHWGLPVVFGHYELPQPLVTPTQIGLDTAAYRTGVLTAIRIEDRHLFQTPQALGSAAEAP
jgi:serine/threonine protein phosphatase 1